MNSMIKLFLNRISIYLKLHKFHHLLRIKLSSFCAYNELNKGKRIFNLSLDLLFKIKTLGTISTNSLTYFSTEV